MTGAPVRLLVNPVAGRGRALRHLDAARHALARVGPFDVVETARAGDEARLATDAVREGVRTLVVLGGDGTVSRAAGALVRAGSDTALAVLGAGTGNDFAKSLGTPAHDFAATAEQIARGTTRRIDVGWVDAGTGSPTLFVNAAGFGFDVAVLERTARARWLRGDVLYVAAALAELFRFRGFPVRVTVPTAAHIAAPMEPHLMLVVANGQWFGGTFRIAPTAALDDGMLDVVLIRNASAWQRARLFSRAPWGRHIGSRQVQHAVTAEVAMHFDVPRRFEADGELHESASATCGIRVETGALVVVR